VPVCAEQYLRGRRTPLIPPTSTKRSHVMAKKKAKKKAAKKKK
jgi:hypothetical protein